MKNHLWILILSLTLALAGCSTVGPVTTWFDDSDEQTEGETSSSTAKFVTVTVKDRYGFRIKDPMGRRITGGSCGIWKDQAKDAQGECCWNSRSECACPCSD